MYFSPQVHRPWLHISLFLHMCRQYSKLQPSMSTSWSLWSFRLHLIPDLFRELWPLRLGWKGNSSKPSSSSATQHSYIPNSIVYCKFNQQQWFFWLHSFLVDSGSSALIYIRTEKALSAFPQATCYCNELFIVLKDKLICLFLLLYALKTLLIDRPRCPLYLLNLCPNLVLCL